MDNNSYLLINSKILPPVFKNVIIAKELLASGKVTSAVAAAKEAGISRSAFYKYKDFVFKYSDEKGNLLNINALLSDRAGVFSALTAQLFDCNANIITMSQGMPENGTANVSLTVSSTASAETIIKKLSDVDGVISVKVIN